MEIVWFICAYNNLTYKNQLFDLLLEHMQNARKPTLMKSRFFSFPHCRKGDNAVIIDKGHILLLEQLMRISLRIEPHVREEATKLALKLKSSISENTENLEAILGFLLLSIYGLSPSFDEDEVLKVFWIWFLAQDSFRSVWNSWFCR